MLISRSIILMLRIESYREFRSFVSALLIFQELAPRRTSLMSGCFLLCAIHPTSSTPSSMRKTRFGFFAYGMALAVEYELAGTTRARIDWMLKFQ